jgi:mRNA interferase MazF
MEGKRFEEWIEVKSDLHKIAIVRRIREGEIWWCALGENVGVEINGKSKTFARPVLILRKLGKYSFMGIPLTSKEHEGSWYAMFYFRNTAQYAALAQARVVSVSRLYKKIGEADRQDIFLVRDKFRQLYCEE